MRQWIGAQVRDPRSGLTGRVIGFLDWGPGQNASLVVQPPIRADSTVPPTVYVPEPVAELIPQPDKPALVQ